MHTKALMAMMLDLDLERTTKAMLPHGSRDIGGGFILLHPREAALRTLQDCDTRFLACYPDGNSNLHVPLGKAQNTDWTELL